MFGRDSESTQRMQSFRRDRCASFTVMVIPEIEPVNWKTLQ